MLLLLQDHLAENEELLRAFFLSASKLLPVGGQVRVSLCFQ
jgi:hypothetical protein